MEVEVRYVGGGGRACGGKVLGGGGRYPCPNTS